MGTAACYGTQQTITDKLCHTEAMDFKKYRWSKDYEAAEEELEMLLDRIGSDAARHQLEAYEQDVIRKFPAQRRIWCAEGSMRIEIVDKQVSLQPGDALDINPDVSHCAIAGVAGCVWYETADAKDL